MISQRYSRQVLLKGFGIKGQENLLKSRVLVIGAGGLGCPVLQILAASGIGLIGIVDDDIISPHNLSRQFLFNSENIGQLKTRIAGEYLRTLNPEIRIDEFPFRLSNQNALETLEGYDIIVDGTDNFESRYMLNDAAYLLGKPLVYGAISEYEGQMGVWNLNQNGIVSLNYRDAFPIPPNPFSFKNCNELGVLGVLTSIIGSIMASEVIKIASGIGKPFVNQIWTYNVLNHKTYDFLLKRHNKPPFQLPKDASAFKKMDYGKFCSINPPLSFLINSKTVETMLEEGNTELIDVREPGELPLFTKFAHKNIPLGDIRNRVHEIKAKRIITFCFSGKRSEQAAQLLKEILDPEKTVFSLEGGLIHWNL